MRPSRGCRRVPGRPARRTARAHEQGVARTTFAYRATMRSLPCSSRVATRCSRIAVPTSPNGSGWGGRRMRRRASRVADSNRDRCRCVPAAEAGLRADSGPPPRYPHRRWPRTDTRSSPPCEEHDRCRSDCSGGDEGSLARRSTARSLSALVGVDPGPSSPLVGFLLQPPNRSQFEVGRNQPLDGLGLASFDLGGSTVRSIPERHPPAHP